MEVLESALREMNSIVAQRCIWVALTHNIPPAVDQGHTLEEKVIVFFESFKKLVRQLNAGHFQGRMTTVQTPDGSRRQTFNSFQIKSGLRNFFIQP